VRSGVRVYLYADLWSVDGDGDGGHVGEVDEQLHRLCSLHWSHGLLASRLPSRRQLGGGR
jgi:hypothetical protein